MTYSLGRIPPIEPIPDPWYQRKARELQRLTAATAGLGTMTHVPARKPMNPASRMTQRTSAAAHRPAATMSTRASSSAPTAFRPPTTVSATARSSYAAPTAYKRPSTSYATKQRRSSAAAFLDGLGRLTRPVVIPQMTPRPSRQIAIPKLNFGFGPSSLRGLGQEGSLAPPTPGRVSLPAAIGWTAVVAGAVGVFWAVTQGGQKPLTTNRRRRGSRKRRAGWSTYAATPGGNWIKKSNHGTMKLAEKAAERLLDTGRYAKVAVERPDWR